MLPVTSGVLNCCPSYMIQRKLCRYMQSKPHIGADVVTWNTLLDMLARCGRWAAALEIYSQGRAHDCTRWQNFVTDLQDPRAGVIAPIAQSPVHMQ